MIGDSDYSRASLRVVREVFFLMTVGVAFYPLGSHASEDRRFVFEVERWGYEEPSFMSKTSAPALIGMAVESYGVQGERSQFYSLRGHLGQTNYSSISTGRLDRTPLYRMQLETGLIRPVSQSLDLFYGLGFRWLYDAAGGRLSSSGHAGYDRESNYFYLPVGFRTPFSQGSLRAQYQIFVQGTQVSHMTDIPGGLSNLSNKQTHGYGYELTYQTDQTFGVYVRYWSISDSSINQYRTDSGPVNAYEPANSTLELGLRWTFNGFD